LVQLSGEVSTSTHETGTLLMDEFISLLTPAGLAGGGGLGAGAGGSAAMPFAPEAEAFDPETALAYAKAMPRKAVPSAGPIYNVWGSAYGGTTRIIGDPQGAGTQDTRGRAVGVAAGADAHLDPDTIVGFVLGGADTSSSVASFGSGRTDAFHAGVYGSRQLGPAYLSGAFSVANYWASTDRVVMVAGTDHLAASFNAFGASGRAEAGYRVLTMPVGITPYTALQVQYFHTPPYSESAVSGSPQFALSFNSNDHTTWRTEFGSWFDQTFPMQNMARLKLFARAAWAHDFNNTSAVTAVFLSLPGPGFIVNGAIPPADLALTTAGAEYRMRTGVSVTARFNGEFGKGAQTYTGTGTIKYEW
jgi:outer membrane autotransporter protein